MVSATVTGGEKLRAHIEATRANVQKIPPVNIGYFESARYPDGTNVAEIAVHHEFGAPNVGRNGIPARPTMGPAMEQLGKEALLIAQEVSAKFGEDPEKFMEMLPKYIGARGASLIQKNIAELMEPELSEATIQGRRTRKINPTTSEKPLIDTGQMRLSVSWAVGNGQPEKGEDNA